MLIDQLSERSCKTIKSRPKYVNIQNKSSPKWFGKSASLSPPRRMHSPTACASCSLYNSQQSVTEALPSDTGRYGTLQSVAGRHRALRKRCGSVTRCCEALRNIMERCATLQDAVAIQQSVGLNM